MSALRAGWRAPSSERQHPAQQGSALNGGVVSLRPSLPFARRLFEPGSGGSVRYPPERDILVGRSRPPLT
ncbi:hypothetical protein [Deinococcus sp.]|uniref:hypothetical protein n=1 Tax=Deinococcus sp. TaxID=47478 RepID=UPI0025B81D7E|nr:hypothetical protein [Deinococcus sp.]